MSQSTELIVYVKSITTSAIEAGKSVLCSHDTSSQYNAGRKHQAAGSYTTERQAQASGHANPSDLCLGILIFVCEIYAVVRTFMLLYNYLFSIR